MTQYAQLVTSESREQKVLPLQASAIHKYLANLRSVRVSSKFSITTLLPFTFSCEKTLRTRILPATLSLLPRPKGVIGGGGDGPRSRTSASREREFWGRTMRGALRSTSSLILGMAVCTFFAASRAPSFAADPAWVAAASAASWKGWTQHWTYPLHFNVYQPLACPLSLVTVSYCILLTLSLFHKEIEENFCCKWEAFSAEYTVIEMSHVCFSYHR